MLASPVVCGRRDPWNKGKLVGQKAPLKLRDIWAIRVRLELGDRKRELALFNMALDSKLRGCDLVQLRVRDVSHGERIAARAIVMQQKTQRPVQFEITEPTRNSVLAWIRHAALRSEDYLFPSRLRLSPHLSTRQYARTKSPALLTYAIPIQSPSGASGILYAAGTPIQSLGGIWAATPQSGETGLMLSDYVGNFFYSTALNSTQSSSCTSYFQGGLAAPDNSGATTGSGYLSDLPAACSGGSQSESYSAILSSNASLILTSAGAESGLQPPINWQYQGTLYKQPSSLGNVAGTWITPSGSTLAIDSSGNISATLQWGCTLLGRIAIIDPGANVYRIGFTYTGCAAVPMISMDSLRTLPD